MTVFWWFPQGVARWSRQVWQTARCHWKWIIPNWPNFSCWWIVTSFIHIDESQLFMSQLVWLLHIFPRHARNKFLIESNHRQLLLVSSQFLFGPTYLEMHRYVYVWIIYIYICVCVWVTVGVSMFGIYLNTESHHCVGQKTMSFPPEATSFWRLHIWTFGIPKKFDGQTVTKNGCPITKVGL